MSLADDCETINCQVCGEALDEEAVYCKSCETAHHLDCWNFVGTCATYGCCEKKYTTEKPSGVPTVWRLDEDDIFDDSNDGPEKVFTTFRPHMPDAVFFLLGPLIYPGMFFAALTGVHGFLFWIMLVIYLYAVKDVWQFDLSQRVLKRYYRFPLFDYLSDQIQFKELTQLRIQRNTKGDSFGLFVSYRGWTFNVSGYCVGEGSRPPSELTDIVGSVLTMTPLVESRYRRRPSLPAGKNK